MWHRISASIEGYIRSNNISYDYLWALFKPGDLVVLQTQVPCPVKGNTHVLACGVLLHYDTSTTGSGETWQLRMCYMDSDRGHVGYVEDVFEFPAFSGLVDIQTLPACPLRFCTEEQSLRKALLERGRRYVELCSVNAVNSARNTQPVLREYNGPIWLQQQPYSRDGCRLHEPPAKTIHSRVAVDLFGFVGEHPIFKTTLLSPIPHKFCWETDPPTLELEPDKFLLFPPRIAGYSLGTKDFGYLLVSELKEAPWETTAAQELLKGNPRFQSVHSIVSGFFYQTHSLQYHAVRILGKAHRFIHELTKGENKTK